MDPETKKYLTKIYERLTRIEERMGKQDSKSSWVTAHQLTQRTGITAKELARMRTLGQVDFKESRGGGWLYKLESVPEGFIKKQTA